MPSHIHSENAYLPTFYTSTNIDPLSINIAVHLHKLASSSLEILSLPGDDDDTIRYHRLTRFPTLLQHAILQRACCLRRRRRDLLQTRSCEASDASVIPRELTLWQDPPEIEQCALIRRN
jgi:hypothetical protein